MSSHEIYQTIHVGPCILKLIDHPNGPSIEYEEELLNRLGIVIEKIPLLSNPLYIQEFAQISNFCWKGTTFNWIASIPDYQSFYNKQIEMEEQFPTDVFPYRLTDYKIFDVSVMHPPQIEEDKLIYFVYNASTGIPYRVVCPFPYTSSSTLVHYQILPLQDSSPELKGR